MNKELPKHILGLDKDDLSHELRKQFKQDHPETIGEKETAFDDMNYIYWLEKQYQILSESAPQGTVEEPTDADIVAIEHLYDVFSNWYHDDGNFDTFLRSEALKAINAYAATKSASSTPNPSVQELIEKWDTLKWERERIATESNKSVDRRLLGAITEFLTDLKSLQSQKGEEAVEFCDWVAKKYDRYPDGWGTPYANGNYTTAELYQQYLISKKQK